MGPASPTPGSRGGQGRVRRHRGDLRDLGHGQHRHVPAGCSRRLHRRDRGYDPHGGLVTGGDTDEHQPWWPPPTIQEPRPTAAAPTTMAPAAPAPSTAAPTTVAPAPCGSCGTPTKAPPERSMLLTRPRRRPRDPQPARRWCPTHARRGTRRHRPPTTAAPTTAAPTTAIPTTAGPRNRDPLPHRPPHPSPVRPSLSPRPWTRRAPSPPTS